jgi:xanthine permease XanP
MKRPVDLNYAVDEVPPLTVTVLSALQHAAILIFAMFTALEICRAAGASNASTVNVLSIGLLLAGLGTLLQAFRGRYVGSGHLLPNGSQAVYLGPSVAAAHAGGLPLVFGMTVVGGLFEAAISRILYRLRPLLPPELSGLVVLLIGMQLAAVGLKSLLSPVSQGVLAPADFAIAALTLSVMIALNVWARGIARLLCILIGIAIGYAVAYGSGLLPSETVAAISATPAVALPDFAVVALAFDPDMIVPFAVTGLAAAMATSANVTVVQRLNDANWVRPDLDTISRGTLADGLVASSSGLLGTCGVGAISANVGAMVATGVASRCIAIAFGAIAALLAVMPQFCAILAATPAPVVGGALLFASAFTMMSGLQIVTSRLLDARKTLMIGLSLVTALAIYMYPNLGALLPRALGSLFAAPMVAAILTGVALTVVFRLGVRRKVRLMLEPAGDHAQAIEDFGLGNGAAWGARPDVVQRAIFALSQFCETVIEHCRPEGRIEIEAEFDEFNLDVYVTYRGEALEFPARRPTNAEILESDRGARLLAGFLLRKTADRLVVDAKDGMSRVQFHFDH